MHMIIYVIYKLKCTNVYQYENTEIIHLQMLLIPNSTPIHISAFANEKAHTYTHYSLHTQILRPAIVLERKPASGGRGWILSSAGGGYRAEGADGEKHQDGKTRPRGVEGGKGKRKTSDE